MPRVIDEFWASASAQAHMLVKHAVTLDEALEAAESSRAYHAAGGEPDGSPNPTGQRRYLVAGRTQAGRRLWVVFADEGGGRGRVITAREARGQAERARHRRMRGD